MLLYRFFKNFLMMTSPTWHYFSYAQICSFNPNGAVGWLCCTFSRSLFLHEKRGLEVLNLATFPNSVWTFRKQKLVFHSDFGLSRRRWHNHLPPNQATSRSSPLLRLMRELYACPTFFIYIVIHVLFDFKRQQYNGQKLQSVFFFFFNFVDIKCLVWESDTKRLKKNSVVFCTW